MSDTFPAGKCLYCSKEYKKAAFPHHLDKHIIEKSASGKNGKSFLVKIDTNPRRGATPYFLMLWVDGKSTMGDIDRFLRQIWLECCGHLSAFRNPKLRSNGGWDFINLENLLAKGNLKALQSIIENNNDEIEMESKVKDVLYKDLILIHEYDFGTTTTLQLTVCAGYNKAAEEKIVLLSRNEPQALLCDDCGVKPATTFCICCIEDGGDDRFCDACAKKHAKQCEGFDNYGEIPIVNSPRMGVCGYEGGRIEKERDRPVKKK